jgi:guanyl-specific ribonuclease Sa
MQLDVPDGCLPVLMALLADQSACKRAAANASDEPSDALAEAIQERLSALCVDPENDPLSSSELPGDEAEAIRMSRRGQPLRYSRDTGAPLNPPTFGGEEDSLICSSEAEISAVLRVKKLRKIDEESARRLVHRCCGC